MFLLVFSLKSAVFFSFLRHPLKTFPENISVTSHQYAKYFNINMTKTVRFALFLLIITTVLSQNSAPCPLPNYAGHVYSAKVLTALDGGLIPITQAQDTQCYNYSLPFSFGRVPDIAIGVHDFQAQFTNGLNFFIKPLHTESLGFVPFAIRTQWPYTQWYQIQFSFIAEDRSDIEAGYYLIDTGILTGCQNGKKIQTFLPFKNQYQNGIQIKHNVFLHGFQVTSIRNQDGSRSPFQFQIYSSAATSSGLQLTLTVTTTTQVNYAYISYVAFQITPLQIIGGGFVYDVTQNPLGLYFAPQTNIPRNYARMYGMTGFLFNNINTKKINYDTKWDGFSFTFNFKNNQNVKYFSFGYIFFTGSICQDCQGFLIDNNGVCVSTCPAGTNLTSDNTCISCGEGRQWNGTACVVSCPQGQFLNPNTAVCQCPPTLNWDGSSCIACMSGRVWSPKLKICDCPQPLRWNGFTCARIDACRDGRVWDVFTYSCQCPQTTFWDGARCRGLPQCQQGQMLNSNFECVCQENYVLTPSGCIFSPCFGGQVWSGTKCVCPLGLNYNGSMCIQCINGQKWNDKNLSCSCDAGYRWNGQLCQRSFICTNGRVWNIIYQQCICPEGSYWTGFTCSAIQKCSGGQYFDSTISRCVCRSGFQWDGKICVQCNNGKVWNVTTLTCSCPIGTTEQRFGCRFIQACTGGKLWNQNSWTCECPEKTVWNGNFCIANPCPFGQRWNQALKSCQCPDNKIYINQACVPPQISCTNGRIWNQNLYACACPPNTFPTTSRCDPMPSCTVGKVYNPLNNLCQCPFGLAEVNGLCADPKCPIGQFWNGVQCQVINCPPPSYFLKDRCVYGGSNNCDFGYLWNGESCNFYPPSCPSGSTWSNSGCQSSQCGNGFYSGGNGQCIPLPQMCPPTHQWDGSKCSSQGNSCPKGTFLQGNNCMPMTPCKNGFVWDPVYIRCICPPGTINNGNRCVECANDQKWIPGVGCACPDGSFDSGAACQNADPNKCKIIANAIWSQNKCRCRPGFTKVGFQCICYGTQAGDFCDKCSYKPNSKLNERTNTCQCGQRFTEIRGVCVEKSRQIRNQDPNKCSVGTYFNQNHKACLACPAGCLSCSDSYTCRVCQPQFIYDPQSQGCIQLCGDGRKFVLQCDDGNNNDGDGCSRDCKAEHGYTCIGGSPQSKDNCMNFRPNNVEMQLLGQVRKSSSISLNIRLNYMPESLLTSPDCSNKCNQVLTGQITQGQRNVVSITAEYIPGTKYFFVINIQFGRPFMARFKIRISVLPSALQYFGGNGVQPFQVVVQPNYLMAINTVNSASDVLT